MTELAFLLHLLLDHKLPKTTREAVVGRIKEVEAALGPRPLPYHPPPPISLPPGMPPQAASTLAAMARHAAQAQEVQPAPPAEVPPAIIAQTPATAAAMASREQAIAIQLSGKPAPGQTRPRKF